MDENTANEDEDKSTTGYGRQISLNFTDKDDKENAKFNDARLVDILRNYPLLYNKSLESYGDPDYTQWMWGEIAAEMNEPHRKTTLNLPFNWTNCRDQWFIVKRAFQYLSNPAAKSFRYPKSFRESLDFFQNYIKDRQETTHTDQSQDTFLNHDNLLEQLPFEQQLSLEKEVLEVILSNELEFCAPITDPKAIEDQAREEFSKVIGLLMPEVDVNVVRNELATEPEPVVVEDLKTNETVIDTVNESMSNINDLLDLYSKPDNSLKHSVSQLDLNNLLQVPAQRMDILESTQSGLHYSIQEYMPESVLQECDVTEDVIEEDIIQEDIIDGDIIQEDVIEEDDIQGNVTQGSVFQECIFQEDVMQEDFIEEVVSQVAAKDMPTLDIECQFEAPLNRLDFVSVLNEMLE